MLHRPIVTDIAIGERLSTPRRRGAIPAFVHPVLAQLVVLAVAALLAFAPAGAAWAQTSPEQQAVQEKLEGQRAVVDSVEAALGREGLRSVDLDELRNRLDPVRGTLSEGIAALDPLLANLNHRVKEIGAKPAADAPPEEPSITREREALTARASELDAVLKQARLLKVRADQLSDSITSRRRALFTDTLLARSYSVLDPTLWLQAAAALPVELRGVHYLLNDWTAYANGRMSAWGQAGVALGALAISILVIMVQRMFARPLHRTDLREGEPLPRLKACGLS